MTIALAEHLLGRLAPGKSYVIDNRARGKKEEKCKCGLEHCIGKPVFESTGIGDERAWHGFIDIVFSSHPVAAVTSSELIDDDEDSPGGKKDHQAGNQAIAQTINIDARFSE
uniref:Uncharacterized protein LOC111114362 n=1 Tax=Crassostrea virginica TaxID=6565 RepID=A0A8B8BY91_CRAVI|nr:uncharacterized protein LOC111114362 [Crassostrea virginica]